MHKLIHRINQLIGWILKLTLVFNEKIEINLNQVKDHFKKDTLTLIILFENRYLSNFFKQKSWINQTKIKELLIFIVIIKFRKKKENLKKIEDYKNERLYD